MDLSTTYLGIYLSNPFIAGPSPFTDHPDRIKLLEDAGAAAVIFPTLFEEELLSEQMALFDTMDTPAESFPEALSYFVEPEKVIIDPESHISHLADVRKHTSLPLIAAINAVTLDGWVHYAKQMEEAGADAIELDFYFVANDASESGEEIEGRFIDVVKAVETQIQIPVSAKLTAFHTSLAHFARRLETAGADGLVLLHRFYEPDIDIENLEPLSRLQLSDSRELLLRLRWLAIISGQVACSLAASGGILSLTDVIKAIMAGADCIQLTSALMNNGVGHIRTLREGLARWLEENGYESLRQMKGSMNIKHIPDPRALSRAHYMHLLGSWGTR